VDEGSASGGFLARFESGVAPGCDSGGWAALRSFAIGFLSIRLFFPHGKSSAHRCECPSSQSIQHRLGKNGMADPKCTVPIIAGCPLAEAPWQRKSAFYTTNIATPAANIATVVIATTHRPKPELGCPCISFLSEATIRMATSRNGANNPLMTAVQ
jgi:hypothetical protein